MQEPKPRQISQEEKETASEEMQQLLREFTEWHASLLDEEKLAEIEGKIKEKDEKETIRFERKYKVQREHEVQQLKIRIIKEKREQEKKDLDQGIRRQIHIEEDRIYNEAKEEAIKELNKLEIQRQEILQRREENRKN